MGPLLKGDVSAMCTEYYGRQLKYGVSRYFVEGGEWR